MATAGEIVPFMTASFSTDPTDKVLCVEVRTKLPLIADASIIEALIGADVHMSFVDAQGRNVTPILKYQSESIPAQIKLLNASHSRLLAIHKEVRDTGVPKTEFLVAEIDGLARTFKASVVPRRKDDKDGEAIVGTTCALVDIDGQQISAEREINRRLLEAKDGLEKALRVKADFMTTMSHEIRTPMNGVLGMIQLLADTSLTEEQTDYVATIFRSGKALLRIIDDILDYSKYEAGKLTLRSAPYNPRDVVLTAFDLVKARDGNYNMFTKEIDPEMPDKVMGDEIRLYQIVINLLGNASKFTEKGHIVMRTKVIDIGERACRVRFEIHDTGAGIDPNLANKLFAPFVQGEYPSAPMYGGSGLGLSICKKMVEAMKGNIGLNSEPGKGSCFWFEIPMQPVPAEFQGLEEASKSPTSLRSIALASERLPKMMHFDFPDAPTGTAFSPKQTIRTATCERKEGEPAPTSPRHSQMTVQTVQLPPASPPPKPERSPHVTTPTIATSSPLFAASRRVKEVMGDKPLCKSVSAAELADLEARHEIVDPKLSVIAEFADHAAAAVEKAKEATAAVEKSCVAKPLTTEGECPVVMIVEDNLVNRKVLSEMLRKLKVKTTVANNGLEAVDAFKGNPLGFFTLILMDYAMPKMDGKQATEAIREYERAAGLAPEKYVPIVVTTANVVAGELERYVAEGMTAALSKPIILDDLVAILHKYGVLKPCSKTC